MPVRLVIRGKHVRVSISRAYGVIKPDEKIGASQKFAEYKTMLPDKKLLQTKLHEFYQILAPLENRAGKEKSE